MNLIPKAVEQAKVVDASTNAPFQSWLAETIFKEDLRDWALRDEPQAVLMSLPEKTRRYKFMGFLP